MIWAPDEPGAGWKVAKNFLAGFPSVCRLDTFPHGIAEGRKTLTAAGSQVTLQWEMGLAVPRTRLWIVTGVKYRCKISALSFRSSLYCLGMDIDDFTREADVLSPTFPAPVCTSHPIHAESLLFPFLPIEGLRPQVPQRWSFSNHHNRLLVRASFSSSLSKGSAMNAKSLGRNWVFTAFFIQCLPRWGSWVWSQYS